MKIPFYYFEMLSAVARKGYVDSILSDLYAYHKRTCYHSIRVSMLSIQIGDQLGMSETDLFTLAESALVYDVGKLKLPLRLLNKPDKLNEEEFDMVRFHPLFSYDRIHNVKEKHADIVDLVALLHHVFLDGSGYPLPGEAPGEIDFSRIPYEARIVCVADIFDAMVSARNYRESYSGRYALKELYRMVDLGRIDIAIVQALRALLENDELLFDLVERVAPPYAEEHW